MSLSFLNQTLLYLKGVGPAKFSLLQKELNLQNYNDLINYYPFRHLDKTHIQLIKDAKQLTDYVLIKAKLVFLEELGTKNAKRLVARVQDQSASIDLIWFQGIKYYQEMLRIGQSYLIFGKINLYNKEPNLTHPEIEHIENEQKLQLNLDPIYSSTEKLRKVGLDSRGFRNLTKQIFEKLKPVDVEENLTPTIIQQKDFLSRYEALCGIHFPKNVQQLMQSKQRLIFEDFFWEQLQLNCQRVRRRNQSKGALFLKVGAFFNNFYKQYLPFELTGAQKKVLKEIRQDTLQGHQMNRLLQGDVGSGKTMVALLTILLALDNGYQACLLAPTEILATQHYKTFTELLAPLTIKIALLVGSQKIKQKRQTQAAALQGYIHILIGTHAILEDKIGFKNLGLAIIDEQHKFGVQQRAKLAAKATIAPHILAMTATPIPRSLAMTIYGDMDLSIIDELPPGRKPIQTIHKSERFRHKVYDFIKREISYGRQIFFVYPIIEESEKLDYENLFSGYEYIKTFFPEPEYRIAMVHGKMATDLKEINMQRFIQGKAQILVATTVIEVGVNIPNASVMVIESAQRFGLSQLHQLRGRVGRGADKSYCILLTPDAISANGTERMQIMAKTNDGFEIAEKDLELRGPGDISGTRQSGALNFKIADISKDKTELLDAKEIAEHIAKSDPELLFAEHQCLKKYLVSIKKFSEWSNF
ncbi:MAG: ATP-dependent DNA helicase RecG [Sediminibacterium sp.]|nr:ATP-dependent DNA helicase RecG [Sediminibacterium sp.]